MNTEAPAGEFLEPWRSINALADSLNRGADSPTFTPCAIRNLVAKRERNGLAPVVIKVGKKVLVSEPGFNRWLTSRAKL